MITTSTSERRLPLMPDAVGNPSHGGWLTLETDEKALFVGPADLIEFSRAPAGTEPEGCD